MLMNGNNGVDQTSTAPMEDLKPAATQTLLVELYKFQHIRSNVMPWAFRSNNKTRSHFPNQFYLTLKT